MSLTWVKEVWEASQSANIHADDEKFLEHRCLPFHNLIICATGLPTTEEKRKLEHLVNSNGGKFTGKLNLQNTDILICYGEA